MHTCQETSRGQRRTLLKNYKERTVPGSDVSLLQDRSLWVRMKGVWLNGTHSSSPFHNIHQPTLPWEHHGRWESSLWSTQFCGDLGASTITRKRKGLPTGSRQVLASHKPTITLREKTQVWEHRNVLTDQKTIEGDYSKVKYRAFGHSVLKILSTNMKRSSRCYGRQKISVTAVCGTYMHMKMHRKVTRESYNKILTAATFKRRKWYHE